MKSRLIIWLIAILFAGWILLRWYNTVPPILNSGIEEFDNKSMNGILGKYMTHKSQEMLLYWTGEKPNIDNSNVKFTDWIWLLRSIDPTWSISIVWKDEKIKVIQGKWTIFLDYKNNLLLNIDSIIFDENKKVILPSFFIQEGKKTFFDLWEIEKIVGSELWKLYTDNVLKDEKMIYNGLTDQEIIAKITTILKREPLRSETDSIYFKKNTEIRLILEKILEYINVSAKKKKCWDNSGSCVQFMTSEIEKWEKIDKKIFSYIKTPLLMWAKKNSNIDTWLSWWSIFQIYHLDTLQNNPSAVSTRDYNILTMIQANQNPTYEMWLYLIHILSKEKKWSAFVIKIMKEMVRSGEFLKNNLEYRDEIITESNKAIWNLRKVLEERYFDKKDNYLYVLKEDLKDEKWQKINTIIFVSDLNNLISEIDSSSLFTEYVDFNVVKRHLIWFTCIFKKNKEYIQDIRVCRESL